MAARFQFNGDQRKNLAACWKRPKERALAGLYLLEVEQLISSLNCKNTLNPPTSIKEQIAIAQKLRIGVAENPKLLEKLPEDFEKLLAAAWLRNKYGDEYFEMHAAACRQDRESNSPRKLMFEAAVRALTPDREYPPPEVSALSKLPPSYFHQTKTDAVFLNAVARAAGEIEWVLKESKAWLDKSDDEISLILMLAYSYETHFGKLPSAANKGRDGYLPPFRSFLELLSTIISAQSSNLREYKFGAPITRDVLATIKKRRALVDLP